MSMKLEKTTQTLVILGGRVIALSSFLLLAGCAATLNDFKKMSSAERADYVCEYDRDIRGLADLAGGAMNRISEIETVLERGYHLHKSCKQIRKEIVTGQTCKKATNTVTCLNTTSTVYEQECTEVPVEIDAGFERSKLKRFKAEYHTASTQLRRKRVRCQQFVNQLSAAEAFAHYKSVR